MTSNATSFVAKYVILPRHPDDFDGTIFLNKERRSAIMSQFTFKSLREYSTTMPTGQRIGKVWKCRYADDSWCLRKYDRIEGDYIITESYSISIANLGFLLKIENIFQ